MRRIGTFLVFSLLSLYQMYALALQEEMQLQLDLAESIFQVRYAPSQWKSQRFGWDASASSSLAKQKVLQLHSPSVKELQRAFRSLFLSCQDYHTDVFFYSTEEATLPFRVIPAQGKYFICTIDRQKLTPSHYPWSIGDELVLFDGKPIKEVIASLSATELCQGRPETDIALSAELLTHRSGLQGHEVPGGAVEVTLKSCITGRERSYFVPWEYVPEKVLRQKKSINGNRTSQDPISLLFSHEMTLPRFLMEGPKSTQGSTEDRYALGSKQSYIPKLGDVIWAAPDFFLYDAYLFELPSRKRAGYIRIPHYKGTAKNLDHFGLLIDFFQKNADVLVIDQINNPGGSPLHLYALASMLTDTPLKTICHRFSLTHHEAANAATVLPLLEGVVNDNEAQQVLGANIDGYPVDTRTAACIKRYLSFVHQQWHDDKTLSEPFPLYGIDTIPPHKFFRYTKPLLVLVNALDFSGGDFFPALLQDNRRAVIMGERTAGAGGMFTTYAHPNPIGIRCYHVTISIAEKEDGSVIENNGVVPDIYYRLTENDIKNDYVDYRNRILIELERLIHGTAAPSE